MKTLVTYASKYGGAKQYAKWIAEELSCDIRDAKKTTGTDLMAYDTVIHGGGLYAGGLNGISVFTKNFEQLREKNLVLFTCGLADPANVENTAHIEGGLAKVLRPGMQEKIKQFHFRSGIDYPRLNLVHRAMMAMLVSTMRKKGCDSLSAEDRHMVDTYGKKVDFSDRDSIKPLIAYVRDLK